LPDCPREPNPLWTADYVETDEIEAYFSRIAKKYNVDSFASYGTEIMGMSWSEERQAWRLELKMKSGEVKEEWTHVVINGVNQALYEHGF
jgi:cation diffusion facilitator CzcD-associated flavoprotein CzcO